jgi:hypothetical protein
VPEENPIVASMENVLGDEPDESASKASGGAGGRG